MISLKVQKCDCMHVSVQAYFACEKNGGRVPSVCGYRLTKKTNRGSGLQMNISASLDYVIVEEMYGS